MIDKKRKSSLSRWIFVTLILFLYVKGYVTSIAKTPERVKRVVGGIKAEEKSWPWQVLITKKDNTPEQTLSDANMHGGGSLLNKKWVLTAAHLFLHSSSLVISVGVFKRPSYEEKISANVQMFTPAAEYVHAEYSTTTGLNDIALLKIGARFNSLMELQEDTSGVTFSDYVQPVHLPCIGSLGNDNEKSTNVVDNQFIEKCLLEEKSSIRGTDVVVTGFGHTKKREIFDYPLNQNYSQYLQQATLTMEDEETCKKGIDDINKVGGHKFVYSDKLICATSNTSDTCQGDSGGPLVRKMVINESRWVQIGIVSYGFGCATDFPGYYTNVAVVRYIDWIKERIEPDKKIEELKDEVGKLNLENQELKRSLDAQEKQFQSNINEKQSLINEKKSLINGLIVIIIIIIIILSIYIRRLRIRRR